MRDYGEQFLFTARISAWRAVAQGWWMVHAKLGTTRQGSYADQSGEHTNCPCRKVMEKDISSELLKKSGNYVKNNQ